MRTFSLRLRDASGSELLPGISSFVGSDASGSFGLLAGHGRFITALAFGLARFRAGDAPWRYLAVPGAVAYFAGDELQITTRRYLLDDDHDRISARLRDELVAEERELRAVRVSLRRMEDELLKRLWQWGRGEA